MAYRKRLSRAAEEAGQRMAAIKSIDPALDLGNGVTVAGYQSLIAETEQQLEEYNTLLSTADGLKNQLKYKERELRDFSERMLVGVAAMYGKNSEEYVRAGGTREYERKRSVQKPEPMPA